MLIAQATTLLFDLRNERALKAGDWVMEVPVREENPSRITRFKDDYQAPEGYKACGLFPYLIGEGRIEVGDVYTDIPEPGAIQMYHLTRMQQQIRDYWDRSPMEHDQRYRKVVVESGQIGWLLSNGPETGDYVPMPRGKWTRYNESGHIKVSPWSVCVKPLTGYHIIALLERGGQLMRPGYRGNPNSVGLMVDYDTQKPFLIEGQVIMQLEEVIWEEAKRIEDTVNKELQ